MTDLDLVDDLSAHMRAFTAHDVPPPDLARRVRDRVRRRQQTRLAVVAGVAAAGTVAGVGLALTGGREQVQLRTAGAPVPTAEVDAPGPGPSDAELRAAQWFHYSSVPLQPDAERAPEERWESRTGEHLALQPDGSLEAYSTTSRFPFGGGEGLTFDELLALPADPQELARRMAEATGGRPVEERVLDQVRQLLARSPALEPVRRALVEAALLQEGTQLVRDAQDSRGRAAFVLQRTDRDGAVTRLFVEVQGYRLLEDRTVVGPDFPTPPTEAPVPGDGQELLPGQRPAAEPEYEPGQLLYQETFLEWDTEPPPGR